MRRAQLFNQRRKPRLQKPLLHLARALRSVSGVGFGDLSMRYIVGLLSVMVTCFALTTPYAAAASIEGSWIGSGTVSHRGNVDRVQCRVRYTKSSKNSYATSSVCTTENGRYDVSGHVTNIGGNRYQGTVTSGNETGRVIMVHRGDQQSVTVTSGSAKLTLSRR